MGCRLNQRLQLEYLDERRSRRIPSINLGGGYLQILLQICGLKYGLIIIMIKNWLDFLIPNLRDFNFLVSLSNIIMTGIPNLVGLNIYAPSPSPSLKLAKIYVNCMEKIV